MNTARDVIESRWNLWLLLFVMVVVALLTWYALEVFLLAFAGILLAVFLHSLAVVVCRYTRLSRGWSLFLVVLCLVSAFGVAVWLLAPNVATQIDNLVERLPRAAERLQQNISDYEWGRRILNGLPNASEVVPSGSRIFSTATGYFSSTLEWISRFVIVIFVGLFLAIEPKTYLVGIKHLIPLDKRARATEVIEQIGENLQWWLIGKVGEMIFIGLLTWAMLWFLGVPLALTLAIISALLVFIPNIGPLIALVPAALLALLESPTKALYVIGFFTAIQTLESYLLTPLVQKRAVSLPPALTIIVQVLMGVIAGGIGLVLATPLLVVAVVTLRMIYVEDVLGDTSVVKSDQES